MALGRHSRTAGRIHKDLRLRQKGLHHQCVGEDADVCAYTDQRHFLHAGLSLPAQVLVPGLQQRPQIPASEGGLVDGIGRVFLQLGDDVPSLTSPNAVRHRQLLPLLGLQIVRSVGIPGKQDRLSPVQAVHHAPHHIGYDVPRLRRSQGS